MSVRPGPPFPDWPAEWTPDPVRPGLYWRCRHCGEWTTAHRRAYEHPTRGWEAEVTGGCTTSNCPGGPGSDSEPEYD